MENFEFTGSMHEPVCKGGVSNELVKDLQNCCKNDLNIFVNLWKIFYRKENEL